MVVDKNQAVIDYLLQFSKIRDNPLFFNFGVAKDNNKQIVTQANDKILNKPYIDGSVLKRYTFTLIAYTSISENPVPVGTFYQVENVEEMFDVQSIIDWITEQEELRNYPNFGEDCIVEEIKAITDNPNLNGIDTSVSPALARYSISIQIQYLDTTNQVWK